MPPGLKYAFHRLRSLTHSARVTGVRFGPEVALPQTVAADIAEEVVGT